MRSLYAAILSWALLLRILVGFHPHSGQDDYQGPNASSGGTAAPVKYGGDYEAQRHWMELTYHLPIGEWYYHDLDYWGLDYPPLTAYVSWACGWAAHRVGSIHDGAFGEEDTQQDDVCKWDDAVCVERMKNSATVAVRNPSRGLGVLKDLVALHSSRWGFEDSGGKMYMRFTVLVLDLLVYMSAVWVLVVRLTEESASNPESESTDKADDPIIPISQRPRLWLLFTALSQPALVLIDHGHFQYNTVSLGLALWSLHFMTMDTFRSKQSSFMGPILGSVLFSLALNFKQMELYHAPAIFAYLLGRCFRQDKNRAFVKFCALGLTVIATFAALWAPFAIHPRASASHLDGIIQILRRLFPFNRGIFEGKVANLWCALSVRPFSIRDRLPSDLLPLAALGLTLVLILPPCWILFKVGRGDAGNNDGRSKQSQRGCDIRLLLWGAASTSLAFFLASFQVHEKGILIPLAPISLLAMDAPHFVSFFSILATWSMWPLLVLDRLSDAYVSCLAIFLCTDSMFKVPLSQLPTYDEAVDIFSDRFITKYIPALGWCVMILLHLMEWVVVPPERLPDLFPVLWSFVGCGLFCICYLATVWAMTMQSRSQRSQSTKKKARNGIDSKIRAPLSVLGILLLSTAKVGDSFPCTSFHNTRILDSNGLHLSKEDNGDITPDLLERAQVLLSYEVENANEAKPILDLSARDPDTLALADGAGEYMSRTLADPALLDGVEEEDASWKNGHAWKITEQHLRVMGILSDGDSPGAELTSEKVLAEAPQLLRLPTDQVVEAASFLLSYPFGKNSTYLVKADPGLLLYHVDDLRYGVEEYLPTMMFMGNVTLATIQIQTQLRLMPSMAIQLIRMGVNGGLQERRISRALGSAAQASGKAVEGVVGEAGRSYREWKRLKGGKGSLG